MKKFIRLYSFIYAFTVKHPARMMLVTIGCILLVPFILIAFIATPWVQSDVTGSIADTVSGVTAPLIGAVSAYLVFVSFQEQVKANRQILSMKREDFVVGNINTWNNKITTNVGSLTAKLLALGYKDIGHALEGSANAFRDAMQRFEQEKNIQVYENLIASLNMNFFEHSGKILREVNALLRYIVENDLEPYLTEITLSEIETLIITQYSEAYHISDYLVKMYSDGFNRTQVFQDYACINTIVASFAILKPDSTVVLMG